MAHVRKFVSRTVRRTVKAFVALSSLGGLGSSGGMPSAQAQTTPDASNPFQLRAAYAEQQDSNLFRLPPGANSLTLTGRSSTDETVDISTLGANLHTRQSLQVIDLDVSVVSSQYQHFGYLNYTATNYNASWGWELTPDWTGHLTSSRAETLNNFTDYAGFGQRNKRTDTASGVDLDYAVGASWHWTLALVTARQANEQALYAGGDFTSQSQSTGLRYTPSSANSASFTLRASTGNYFNQSVPSSSLIDNTYSELDQLFNVQWTSDDGTQLTAELMPFQRTQPNYPQRNYNGVNTSLSGNWNATAKINLNAAVRHTVSSYATANTNYSTTDTLVLGSGYVLNSRSVISLQQQWDQIDYVQLTGAALGADRQDTLLTTTLAWNWQPRDHVSVSTSLQGVSRSTNANNLDYRATVFFVNATFTY